MLTDKPSSAQIEATVHRTIVDVLERSGKSADGIDNDQPLVATGLTSLDLAALLSMLQTRLKADPFFATTAITDVRTVGDLCRAYQDYIKAN